MPIRRIDMPDSRGPKTADANAAYTYDLLLSLRGLAVRHNQTELAWLIEKAAEEAQRLIARQKEKAG